METLRKKLWALLFLCIFIPLTYPGGVRADTETTERPGQRSFKIVGGQTVNPPGAYPWTVQIGYHRPFPNEHFFTVWCGGALIDRSWVLTAAHCFDDTTGSRYTLTLGEHDLNQHEGTEQVINVQEVIVHPDYNAFTSDNDIALLRLAHPANIDARVNTIELGPLPTTPLGAPLTVVGWGTTTFGGTISTILLETSVPLRTDTDCHSAYPGEITNTMFCAGFDGGGTDSCQGDSGGPIFFNEGGISRQVGVVSWGDGCAAANKFGVYANVALFTDWIHTTTGGETPVPIPNVIGQTQANGEVAIVAAGLTVGSVTTATHQSIQTGTVISLNPAQGTMVAPGTSVDLLVSSGSGMVTNIPISPPPTVGSISEAGMVNLFEFTVENQGSYTIETKGITNGMDTMISLYESDNQVTPLEQNDDIVSGNVNSRITRSLAPGTYVVKVRHYYSTQVGDYTIFVRNNE